jgi:hypothetical protein
MLALAMGRRSCACATVWKHDSTAFMKYVLVCLILEPVSKNIYYKGITFIADRFLDCDEHTRHPRDQPGQRRDTRHIVCTAGAAAWLPHSKPRHTRMMSDQGNLCSA